jgi:hypothetical protein
LQAGNSQFFQSSGITNLFILPANGNGYDFFPKVYGFSGRFKTTAGNNAGAVDQALTE